MASVRLPGHLETGAAGGYGIGEPRPANHTRPRPVNRHGEAGSQFNRITCSPVGGLLQHVLGAGLGSGSEWAESVRQTPGSRRLRRRPRQGQIVTVGHGTPQGGSELLTGTVLRQLEAKAASLPRRHRRLAECRAGS